MFHYCMHKIFTFIWLLFNTYAQIKMYLQSVTYLFIILFIIVKFNASIVRCFKQKCLLKECNVICAVATV